MLLGKLRDFPCRSSLTMSSCRELHPPMRYVLPLSMGKLHLQQEGQDVPFKTNIQPYFPAKTVAQSLFFLSFWHV